MSDSKPSIRERKRRAVQHDITETALRLFAHHGFDTTTIDHIAEETGISRRSFFHYFASKEDLVLGDIDALGATVLAALQARPAEETAWEAIRAALLALQPEGGMTDRELTIARLCHDVPSLRARHLEKHLRWQSLLAPDIQRRLDLPTTETPDPRALAFVATALACMDAAIDAWHHSGGAIDPVTVFDDAIATIRA